MRKPSWYHIKYRINCCEAFYHYKYLVLSWQQHNTIGLVNCPFCMFLNQGEHLLGIQEGILTQGNRLDAENPIFTAYMEDGEYFRSECDAWNTSHRAWRYSNFGRFRESVSNNFVHVQHIALEMHRTRRYIPRVASNEMSLKTVAK